MEKEEERMKKTLGDVVTSNASVAPVRDERHWSAPSKVIRKKKKKRETRPIGLYLCCTICGDLLEK